ncbi:MAG: hypothetical protein ACXAEX_07095 [Promethearchaeota archaeon]|jgi:hypothetical protein
MTENIDLKELEKKAWRSTFQDGLWDIYFGLLFFGLGIYTVGQLFGQDDTLSAIIILMIWDFTSVFLFIIAKRKITIPRMGFVKFGKARKVKKIKLAIFLVIMVGINIIFLFLPLSGLNIRLNAFTTMLIIGTLFITTPFCVIAYFLEFERLYLIAIMGGLGLSIAELFRPIVGSPLHSMITFCTIGTIIMSWGIVFLIRFLREYPLTSDDQKLEVTNG